MERDAPAEFADDGLACRETAPYVEEKHRTVSLYAGMFSEGMRKKWQVRTYLELYSGPGYAKIRTSGKVIPGSPIRALTLEVPFDKYIFCERDENLLSILKTRVQRHAPSANVSYILGDRNEQIDAIMKDIPKGSSRQKALTLCFVDPPDIGIKFKTLKAISARYVDFLVLLALYMDANRNINNYVRDEQTKIDHLLGSSTWRSRWTVQSARGIDFPRFLTDEFSESMAGLGYQSQPFFKTKAISISEAKNVLLYRLALYSRHPQAYGFWDQVLKYSSDQKKLWDESEN